MKFLPVVLVLGFLLYQGLNVAFAMGRVLGAIEQKQRPSLQFVPEGGWVPHLAPWGTQVNDATGKAKRA